MRVSCLCLLGVALSLAHTHASQTTQTHRLRSKTTSFGSSSSRNQKKKNATSENDNNKSSQMTHTNAHLLGAMLGTAGDGFTHMPGSVPPSYCDDLWKAGGEELLDNTHTPLQTRGGDAITDLQSCARMCVWCDDTTQVERIGAGAFGEVFEVKNRDGDTANGDTKRTAVKCMETQRNQPRVELCATLQANRGVSLDQEKRIAPEIFDAWRCDARAEENVRGVTCIEMEFIPDAGQSFAQIIERQGVQAGIEYQHKVFDQVQQAIERGVVHNDLHCGNVGVFPHTQDAVLFDWGLAHVCRKTVPDFFRPIVYASQIATWVFVTAMMQQAEACADVQAELMLLANGEHPVYKDVAPVRFVELNEKNTESIQASLQYDFDARHFEVYDPSEPIINALMKHLTRSGKTVFKPERAEVTVRFPPSLPGQTPPVMPVVEGLRFEGLANSWAVDGPAAEKLMADVTTSECENAREWLDSRTELIRDVHRVIGEEMGCKWEYGVEILQGGGDEDVTVKRFTLKTGGNKKTSEGSTSTLGGSKQTSMPKSEVFSRLIKWAAPQVSDTVKELMAAHVLAGGVTYGAKGGVENRFGFGQVDGVVM